MRTVNRVFLVLSIAWMVFIFSMSAQPAAESSDTSLYVGKLVCTVFVPHYKDMGEAAQTDLAEKIDHPVRKTAHATEYAILGILVFMAIPKDAYFIAFIVAAAYASSDEIHQLFVEGRSGQVTDVMIDSCGAAAGLLLVYIIKRLFKKRSR